MKDCDQCLETAVGEDGTCTECGFNAKKQTIEPVESTPPLPESSVDELVKKADKLESKKKPEKKFEKKPEKELTERKTHKKVYSEDEEIDLRDLLIGQTIIGIEGDNLGMIIKTNSHSLHIDADGNEGSRLLCTMKLPIQVVEEKEVRLTL